MLKNPKAAKITLVGSFVVFAFYLVGALLADVYRYPIVGAIYELLWLPMLASLLVIPVISVLVFIRNKDKARVYAVLSVLFIITSIIIMAVK
jgi:hypothetical protein